MPQGSVKKLCEKGFGFIKTGKKDDLFFHRSVVADDGFDLLAVDQPVEFTEEMCDRGRRATFVKPL